MPPLIVGAGPAGCAAALALHARGIIPAIVERDATVHDAICGGFMSWRTLATLARLGVDVAVDCKGHRVDRVAVFAGTARATARLPRPAMGLSRRRLDTTLRAQVTRRGMTIEQGVDVREAVPGRLRLADGTTRDATTIFLASGKHDVRGLPRPRDTVDPTLGLRLRLPPHPALAKLIGDAIELHLFDRAYVGLMLQEDGSANLCLAVRKSRLTQAGGTPRSLLEALGSDSWLGERLAFADTSAIDAIASVPYGWRATTTEPGIYRLGDQAAVIPSLAGEGIGIAVASGIAAADAFADGHDAATFQRSFAARTRRPVAVARQLWQGAESPRLAALGVQALRAFPTLARVAARMTRIGY